MSQTSVVQPSLLSKMNERQVLRTIQARGPLSRAEVARHSGISAPTASKAVESLLRAGLLEEGEAPEAARGRPAKKLRLASSNVQVLGVVVDAEQCRVVCAGLDGKIDEERTLAFPTPDTYDELIEQAAGGARRLKERTDVSTLGLAISLPGLVDYRTQCGVLSPNVPMTDGHCPPRDLEQQLDLDCILIQESHALCLAERHYGAARGIDNFAMMDVSTGVGLGVFSGGRLLTGRSGIAGEVGHITVELDGRLCGCGNHGCLETVASDAAFAWTLSRRLGRRVTTHEALALVRSGEVDASDELDRCCRYLAIGIASVINLFNPSSVFVHGKLLAADEVLFNRLIEETRRRTLPPSFEDCRIVQARGSKRQGAVAAIIEHLTNSVVPTAASEPHYHPNGSRQWWDAPQPAAAPAG